MTVTHTAVGEFLAGLEREERSPATRRQYQRDLQRFLRFAAGAPLTKGLIIRYKEELQRDYLPTSVNAKLAALNGFLRFTGRPAGGTTPQEERRAPPCP